VVGGRHAQNPQRQASRWGKENGYCVIDGQKVPIKRTRVRDNESREVTLGSYELFQRSGPLQAAVWDTLMRGLSTRNYAPVVKDFRPSLRRGEIGGEREIHRGQPRETEGADGAARWAN
jgi:hypothetical protein